jgi:UDP-N-acetylmuramate--alanine ligase
MTDADSSRDSWPSPGTRVHLVGICGSGMRALAELLHDAGCRVSGSDLNPDPEVTASLRQRGIFVQTGHEDTRFDPPPELLIHSPAVGPENPERATAERLGIPHASYVETLGRLMRSRRGIAVAGTHGKSTTTALLGEILRQADADPTVVCGAAIRGDNRSGRLGRSELCVVEACEYRRHFLHLTPEIVCLLGIEPDHFDCYPTLDDALNAYREFIERVPAEGTIVFRSDCPSTGRVMQESAARKVSFSITDPGADWFAEGIEPADGGMRFTLRAPAGSAASQEQGIDVRLPQPGRHNVLNALAAAATAGVLGIGIDRTARGLAGFPGLRRRFEPIGYWRDARVIDDFAHHPTEIAATIAAARESFAPRRLICVFQPHQVSRTRALLEAFAESLSQADRSYVLPVYGARERTAEENLPVARELVEEIRRRGGASALIPALDQVWTTLETDAPEADLILILGAGDIARLERPVEGIAEHG